MSIGSWPSPSSWEGESVSSRTGHIRRNYGLSKAKRSVSGLLLLSTSLTNNSHRMYFDLLIVLLFGLIWIGIITFLRLKKSLTYLIFFTIFYIYIVKVLDYTLFQFQYLILLKHFMPDLILNGQTV